MSDENSKTLVDNSVEENIELDDLIEVEDNDGGSMLQQEEDVDEDDDDVDDDGDGFDPTNYRIVFEESGERADGEDEPIDMSFCCFQDHTDSVYCAALHPSRPGVVITGGGDDKAFIWKYAITDNSSGTDTMDVEGGDSKNIEGQVVHSVQLSGHTDTVTAVGFNFNGSLALTGSYDGTVRVWNVDTGALQLTLEGPEDVEWAHWHGRGNAIIAGSRDGTVWMWLTHDGQCIHVFAGHEGGVSAGCFSKDGKSICTGGEDGTVRHWNPKSGVCRHVFEGGMGHGAMVTCVDSGGDGDMIVTGSADGIVKLYKLTTKKLLHSFIHSIERLADEADQLPTVAEEGGDGEDGEVRETAAVMGVECVGFSSAELKFIASGGMDKTLKIWDTATGTLRSSCLHGGSVVSLKWHATSPAVCTAALDNLIRIWDARNGALLVELTGHTNMVTGIELCPLVQRAESTCSSSSSTHESRHKDVVSGMAELNGVTDAIISLSDDNTARIYLVDMLSLV